MLRKQHVLNAPKRMRETRSPISPRELSRLGHGFPFLILDSHRTPFDPEWYPEVSSIKVAFAPLSDDLNLA